MKPFVCVRIKRNLSYRGQLFIGRREGFVTRWTTSRRRQNVETKRPRWCPPTTTVTTWNLLRRRRPRITKNLFRLDRDRYENKFFFFLRASTAEALLPNARGRGQTRLSFFLSTRLSLQREALSTEAAWTLRDMPWLYLPSLSVTVSLSIYHFMCLFLSNCLVLSTFSIHVKRKTHCRASLSFFYKKI